MKVELAGYNVDKDLIREIASKNDEIHDFLNSCRGKIDFESAILCSRKVAAQNKDLIANLTPETIAASYARISRDPRDIPELREDARKDVESCRKSNEAIIFTMGHKSISEHAVLNFDIMNISRSLIERIEQMRLVSYTEKSQRYIDMDSAFVLPEELTLIQDPSLIELTENYVDLVENLFNFYKNNKDLLTQWHSDNTSNEIFEAMGINSEKRKTSTLEGWGKEDARYALPMATEAQLGMTINGRNLEALITRMRSSDIMEDQKFGKKLYDLVNGFAPSIIKYLESTNYYVKTRDELKEFVDSSKKIKTITENDRESVNLFDINNRDKAILAGLIFSHSNMSFKNCLYNYESFNNKQKLTLDKLAHKYQEKHDVALREYELREPIEMIVSASNFAQLKRHRMNTLIPQDYDISLDITIPPSIIGCDLEINFRKLIQKTNSIYNKITQNPITAPVANYILTNAHRRRVLLDANNRQLKAIANERKNLYAQWDIRNSANELINKMKELSPLTLRFAPGKHEFYDEKERIYGKD